MDIQTPWRKDKSILDVIDPEGTLRELKSVQDIVPPRYTKRKSSRKIDTKKLGKLKLIQDRKSKGCDLCGGFNRLTFHHVYPEDKVFHIPDCKASVSVGELIVELDKCVVLCNACHASIHNEMPLKDVAKWYWPNVRKVRAK